MKDKTHFANLFATKDFEHIQYIVESIRDVGRTNIEIDRGLDYSEDDSKLSYTGTNYYTKNGVNQIIQNFEETQVDPNKVMDFLNANNFFVNVTNAPAPVEGGETDPTVADRVAGYMENFELIYGIIEQEFGPEKAPAVMDAVMDILMGMVG